MVQKANYPSSQGPKIFPPGLSPELQESFASGKILEFKTKTTVDK